MAGNKPGRDYCTDRNNTGAPERRPGTAGKSSRTPVFRIRSGLVSIPVNPRPGDDEAAGTARRPDL